MVVRLAVIVLRWTFILRDLGRVQNFTCGILDSKQRQEIFSCLIDLAFGGSRRCICRGVFFSDRLLKCISSVRIHQMSVLTRCHAQNSFSCHVSTSSVALEQLRRLIHQDFLYIYFSFLFLLQARICLPLCERRYPHARKMNARNICRHGVTSSLKAAYSPGSCCLSAFYHSYPVPPYYIQGVRNLCFAEMLRSSCASQRCVLEICWGNIWHDTSWLQRVSHRMKQCLTVEDGYNESWKKEKF